ncbi:hydantoinase/oxoprolinase family protein [Enterovirga rhinocerotis]|uniref:N-methylhydantoinase A n=1 Tax=Enterovirga rhinocerotis TaxID=1339210 RepID=A0A4R7C025_9HYPH|nr:hydantoinase/oxoprolinase family protein [Enterovirga rhinocerotis]TDR89817.1 N-methylhydantoinase A [Enterovirga rhinocerotis]
MASSPSSVSARLEIGVDIGGTFTDVVCREAGGAMHVFKLPTTRGDPSDAVIRSVAELRERQGVDPAAVTRFAHGTTVATNAVLERKGARIGLLTTEGFRDVIEIARQLRMQVYKVILEPEAPVFLAPRRFRKEVRERIGAAGEIVTPLDEACVLAAADELVAAGVEAIAICFLFSFRNAAHEIRAAELIRARHPGIMLSLSHEVDPAFREYERTVVTAFDAYVKPRVDTYLARLEEGLSQAGVGAPLQVMQSRGGLASSRTARDRPVRLFLSGPAAGVIGGQIVGASAGVDDLITIDIGGTSADIALISRRKPLLRAQGSITGYPVRVAMVDVNAIGAGGGSIAKIDASGGLRVGPDSAGSEPGPACYGRGGTEPTTTDASIVLGWLDPDYFAGGRLKLLADKAREAVAEKIAKPLGMTPEQAALGIHRVLNAQMAEGIRLVSVRQGVDPRKYALVPLGGAGGIHATALARELGISRIVVPRIPGVLAAAGLLAAPIEHEVSADFGILTDQLDRAALDAKLAELDAKASVLMKAENAAPGEVTVSYSADLCYVGQSYNLEIPIDLDEADIGTRLYRDFLAAHDRVYGHSVENPVRIVALRSVHRAGGSETIEEMRFAPTDEPVEIGHRDIVVTGEAGPVRAVVYRREALPEGFRFEGPALVQQTDTTTLIEPGWSGLVDAAGNLVLTRKGA